MYLTLTLTERWVLGVQTIEVLIHSDERMERKRAREREREKKIHEKIVIHMDPLYLT